MRCPADGLADSVKSKKGVIQRTENHTFLAPTYATGNLLALRL